MVQLVLYVPSMLVVITKKSLGYRVVNDGTLDVDVDVPDLSLLRLLTPTVGILSLG
jgi:hypothetical protein